MLQIEFTRLNQKWIIVALVLLAGCVRYQPRPILPTETAANLEARTLDTPAFKEFLDKNLQRQFESWPPKSWDFELLNLAALYYHPSLDVARAQWQVTVGGNKTAAARPNPILSAVPGYNISATHGVSPWFPAVTLEVPIETGGKRAHRRAQAQHLSESARLNILVTALQVRSNLRSSLIDLTAARERERLLQNQKSIQDKILQSLEQQLQAGAVSSSELTLVRISWDKIRLDLSDAHQQSADALVRAAGAIGVSVKALDGLGLAYDLSARPPGVSDLMSVEVRRQALQSRADILAALAEYAASQSALQLEIAKQYPDVHLGPGYQFDQGDHKFSLALTAEVPLLNQNQGPISQAESRRTEAAARFNALQSKVITEVDRALAMYRVSQENLSTLDSLAESQKKRTESMEAQLKAGAADQLDLMNSQSELNLNELLQLSARVKLQQSFGALEDALQRPIDSPQPLLIEQGQRP
ncbi:MAG: TolC family protein [Verrucomicrobiota bacterium]